MMPPAEFMMYATPILVLASHLVSEVMERSRAAKAKALIEAAQQLTTSQVSNQVRRSSELNAEHSANLVAAKMAPAQEANVEKLETIHGLVNGTLTLANQKIESLTLELKRLKEAQENPGS